jgi:hypothetical protein
MDFKFLGVGRRRYLLLLPMVFLLLNAYFFQHATREIRRSILPEKYIDTLNQVESLAAAVEANPERLWEDHELNIRHSVAFIDTLPMTFAAVYKPVNDVWMRISERDFATNFDPLIYDEFLVAVDAQERGNIDVGFTPENGSFRVMHLYFRMMPLYSSPEQRYLVVTGVSSHSVVTPIPGLVSIGQWVSMAITFILNVWLIVLIARARDLSQLSECEICQKRSGGDAHV